MKTKLISLMIASMMAVSLVACGDKKEADNTSNNNKTVTSASDNSNYSNNEKDDKNSDETVKVTEDELKKINSENIERLKAFYDKNGLPYSTDNKYNSSVEEARIYLRTAKLEENNIDTKGMRKGEYQYLQDYKIQASISMEFYDELDLNNSLLKEYCEAIVNDNLDFSKIDKSLEEYKKNFSDNSSKFIEVINTDNYSIQIAAVDNEVYGATILSKFEIK